jgi:hypothetical protein
MFFRKSFLWPESSCSKINWLALTICFLFLSASSAFKAGVGSFCVSQCHVRLSSAEPYSLRRPTPTQNQYFEFPIVIRQHGKLLLYKISLVPRIAPRDHCSSKWRLLVLSISHEPGTRHVGGWLDFPVVGLAFKRTASQLPVREGHRSSPIGNCINP